ncbi:MAG: radical SAM protein [Patescibacteria group bacterium]
MPKTNAVNLGLHLLEVELTTRCNESCTICYNRTGANIDMPLREIIRLTEFGESHGVNRLVNSGGEASMHPEFRSLVLHLKSYQHRMQIAIQSNGLIGESGLSLKGAFDIVHLSFEPDDSIVRKTSVAKLIDLAKRYQDEGIYVYFYATVHPGNIDQIDWMVDKANSVGIDIGFNICIAGHRERLQLSPEQRLTAITKLHQLAVAKRTLRFTSPYVAILKDQQADRYIGNRGGCTAGIAACIVLPNGDVAPCPFLRIKAGNIYEQDLKDIWLNSEIFSSIRDRSVYDEPCGSCKFLSYCGGCRASAHSVHRITGSDPQCILQGIQNH